MQPYGRIHIHIHIHVHIHMYILYMYPRITKRVTPVNLNICQLQLILLNKRQKASYIRVSTDAPGSSEKGKEIITLLWLAWFAQSKKQRQKLNCNNFILHDSTFK